MTEIKIKGIINQIKNKFVNQKRLIKKEVNKKKGIHSTAVGILG